LSKVCEQIQFCINGYRHSINDERAFLSLAEYLRDHCRLVGTKVVCNEGDCGACTVLVGRFNRQSQLYDYQALDSCIVYIFQLDGTSVVTVEGVGDPTFISPIQQAMVRCHGSQCGFCTPGFVMAMHGMVEAYVPPTENSLRYELSGNLCRCTGYTSIVEAGMRMNAENCARMNTRYRADEIFSQVGRGETRSINIKTLLGTISIPTNLSEAALFRELHPNATVVNGATDYGVLRNHGRLQAADTLCLVNVEDFDSITLIDRNLSIGGGANWYQIENAVRHAIPEYYAILTRFGSPQIRKTGTIGGNLASGSPIADAVPFHLVMEAQVELVSAHGRRMLPLEEFYLGYRTTALRNDELIAAVHTPVLKPNERLKLFKLSKRRDMDISTATFALRITCSDTKIIDARAFMGGAGPTVLRLKDAETALIGSNFSEEVFRSAGKAARNTIQPWTDVRGDARYRLQVAENFFMKSYFEWEAADA
jgi:xanthine dehydrogenase small subunit